MAFGSALRGGTRDGGTVRLTADTGEFNAKVEQAERQWRESVGQMSREALKLDLAQDRLRRSLASYGAESNQAKRATIALKDAEEQATRAARGLDRAHDQQRRSTLGLRGSVVGLAAAYVGTQGLLTAFRSVLGAARESELVLGQTQVALENAGLSWARYGKRIEEVIKAQSRLGFDDEQLLKTFSTFIVRTGDVEKSLRLNALAADVARGRYIDLEQAAQLVLKASLGQAGALRRLGIDAKKGADATQLLTLLTDRYAGRARAAAETGIGAQDRLNVAWENAQEIVGGALVPIVSEYSDRITRFLDDADNQEELQRRVNAALSDGAAIVRGLAGALKNTAAVVRPFVNALGGFEQAARLAFGIWIITRLRGIAGALTLVSTNAFGAAAGVTALGRAEATAAAQGAGLGGALAGRGGGGFVAAAGALAVGGLTFGGSGVEQRETRIVREGNRFFTVTADGAFRREITAEQATSFGFREPSAGPAATGNPVAGDRPTLGEFRTRSVAVPTVPRPRRRPGSTLGSLQQAQLEAQLTSTLADDMRADTALLDFQQRRLSRTKSGTKAYREALGDVVSAQGARQGILDQLAAADEKAAKELAERTTPAEHRLTALQGAVLEAQLKRSLPAELKADTAILALQRRRLRQTRRGTDAYLELLPQVLSAQQERQSVQDQLDAADEAAAEKRKEALQKQRERTSRLIRRAGLRGVLGATPAQGAAEFLRGGSGASEFGRGAQQLLEDLSGLLGRFSSDILTAGEGGRLSSGSRPVTIEQHFHADRSQSSAIREARLAATHNL